jgi:pentatricopeptide repeat protein
VAKIALHDYLNEIEQLLEVEQTSDVIDHCRHILRQYPRHVDTYRTLAKALLEQRDFDDAAELFQRILSTDPNDFVAHVGLSAVFREKQEYTESVWHLERAFEMDPYNAALQEELKELYELRDEQRPRRVPLTRASLARLYVKGELYQQAASELSQILAENGTDRVDLEILLAEALWRDGQRVDAVDISLKVLEKLPNSVTINAILGEIWLLTGRTEEAQEYLQRLLALTQVDQSHLDPDSVIGHAFNTEGAPKLPNVVSVERKGEGTSDLPDWGGDKIADKTVTDDEAVYDWLRDAGVVEEILADEEDDVFDTSTDWFTDQTDVQSDEQEAMARAADWLDDLGVVSETGDSDFGFGFTEEFASETSMEQPEDLLAQDDSLGWLTDSGTGDGADAEIPDWMEDFAENRPDVVADDDEMTTDWFRVGDDDAVDTVADESGTDWFKTEDEPISDEGTDWLTEDDSEDAPAVSVPDWLSGTNIEEEDTSEAELVAFDTDELMSSTEGDEPDWLMGDTDAFAGETADSTEDVSFTDQLWADEADQDEFGVDWLGAANTIDLSQIEGTLPVDNADAEDDDVDGLDWLIESETEGIKTADSVDLADLIDSEQFGTDPLLSGASAEVADWLMGGEAEQFGDEDQLSFEDAQVFDTS